MKLLLAITVLGMLALNVSSQAIVCTPDICRNAKCDESLAETCTGVIIPNSSFCGCCPTCTTFLPPYAPCLNVNILFLTSDFKTAVCLPGFICKNGKCSPLIEADANVTE
uniref:Secreted peptide n=1 Tax=Pristhesancus plagipennis TaxID=1955184 RepID=A0A2K8JMD5_PRIPG|nr:secreted peptide [Pristhesancus plagipennis]